MKGQGGTGREEVARKTKRYQSVSKIPKVVISQQIRCFFFKEAYNAAWLFRGDSISNHAQPTAAGYSARELDGRLHFQQHE
jgi:hypothetical protein